MAYGLKYQTQFSSQSDANTASKDYTLQFLFKDYSGGGVSVIGGDTSVIQRCTVDDPVAPIKGQSLDIVLVNQNGSLPITSFYSEDDDGVQVKLLDEDNNVLFIGYLVQDDFYEEMVDYNHYIRLSANDSLGLLKGVILSEASVRRAFEASYRTNGVDTVVYMWVTDLAFYPQTGDIIEIDGNTYTIITAVNETTTIGIANYNWTITVDPTTGGISQTVDTVYLTGEINLRKRNSLLSIFAICLAQTNLQLITKVWYDLYEFRQDLTISMIEQTMLDTQLFISGETYDNCYNVLEKILSTFQLTLFQANGTWNIVHWYEARLYTDNAIPCFIFDETWARAGTDTFTNNFEIGPSPQLTVPIYPLTQGALRGYKFTRETFNYNQPKYLLANYDLLEVGDLLRTYANGSETIYEYVAIGWEGGYGATLCERFIRVAKDSVGAELYRFLIARGNASDTTRAIASQPIEISEGDKIKFSFSFKTNISQPGPLTIIFAVQLYDGTLTRYVDEVPTGNGNWISTVGFNYSISSGDNSNTWQSVEIESSQTPFSGLVTCYLAIATDAPYNASRETYYKDLRFEVTQYINDSTKVIGHIHKQEQDVNKKNTSDIEVYIDDSPRNTIVGTLFLPTFNGLLQNRTLYWQYPTDGNGWRLGEISTLNLLRWRQQTRSKLEGGFIGNWQGSIISLLTMAITDFEPTKNYTFGLLTIDYKRNQFSGTLWEMYDTEQDEIDNTYTLTYIYSTT